MFDFRSGRGESSVERYHRAVGCFLESEHESGSEATLDRLLDVVPEGASEVLGGLEFYVLTWADGDVAEYCEVDGFGEVGEGETVLFDFQRDFRMRFFANSNKSIWQTDSVEILL